MSLPIRQKLRLSHVDTGGVQEFYCRDDNSRATAGKKEVKTINEKQVQKRYLCRSIGLLCAKYLSENCDRRPISLATFYRLGPKSVLVPKLQDRRLCLCKTCDNFQLIVDALYMRNVTSTRDAEQICASVTCDPDNYTCARRMCLECSSKLPYDTTRVIEGDVRFCQCEKAPLSSGSIQVTRCVEHAESQLSVVGQLMVLLAKFSAHLYRARHQYRMIRDIKTRLWTTEALIHFDFSENYTEKMGTMVQSAYYGAHVQTTIQQGVYYHDGVAVSFASLSDSGTKSAAGVVAHIHTGRNNTITVKKVLTERIVAKNQSILAAGVLCTNAFGRNDDVVWQQVFISALACLVALQYTAGILTSQLCVLENVLIIVQ